MIDLTASVLIGRMPASHERYPIGCCCPAGQITETKECAMNRSTPHWRRMAGLLAVFAIMFAQLIGVAQRAQALSPNVVISQVYGGGGNTGATYTNDFIELFNRSASAVNITGWSVQYASATGTSYAVTNLSGTLQPGGHYLVQEAVGAG